MLGRSLMKLRERFIDDKIGLPKHKRTNKRRSWVTRDTQRKRRAKNKACEKFHTVLNSMKTFSKSL